MTPEHWKWTAKSSLFTKTRGVRNLHQMVEG
ncbi:hypothetical protein CIPAW_13G140200 [Carya illinoinensis]|uniref:Uncharacterized protein n=1 Tax=Carya illinoinensis TaxID=32201 RepID=A0A8T1NKQ6_CARIL|nr:hypothetical protein CIPAW_13G140200 [Carya illinoinensis]